MNVETAARLASLPVARDLSLLEVTRWFGPAFVPDLGDDGAAWAAVCAEVDGAGPEALAAIFAGIAAAGGFPLELPDDETPDHVGAERLRNLVWAALALLVECRRQPPELPVVVECTAAVVGLLWGERVRRPWWGLMADGARARCWWRGGAEQRHGDKLRLQEHYQSIAELLIQKEEALAGAKWWTVCRRVAEVLAANGDSVHARTVWNHTHDPR